MGAVENHFATPPLFYLKQRKLKKNKENKSKGLIIGKNKDIWGYLDIAILAFVIYYINQS